jgi:hypothetical protein
MFRALNKPLSIHKGVRYCGNDEKIVHGISTLDEAVAYLLGFPISDERSYVGATYRKDKHILYIHRHLDEIGFQYSGKTKQRTNSVFLKCVFLFKKVS